MCTLFFNFSVKEALFQPVKIKQGELVNDEEIKDKQVSKNILYRQS